MYCRNCGKALPAGSKYCNICGTPAAESNEEQTPQNRERRRFEPMRQYEASIRYQTAKHREAEHVMDPKKKTVIALVIVILALLVLSNILLSSITSKLQEKDQTPVVVAAEPSINYDQYDTVSQPVVEETAPTPMPIPSGTPMETDSRNGVAESVQEQLHCTPLTDFYLHLNSDNTITLKAFETHDKACLIAPTYIVDGTEYTVHKIGDACFFGRTSLETLLIPEGVTDIANNTFNSCSVKVLFLPSTLRDIHNMFDYLHGDVIICYAGSEEQWWQIRNVGEIPDSVTVYVDVPNYSVTSDREYSSDELVLHKSSSEKLGSSIANAINGLVYGFDEGLNDEDDSEDEDY